MCRGGWAAGWVGGWVGMSGPVHAPPLRLVLLLSLAHRAAALLSATHAACCYTPAPHHPYPQSPAAGILCNWLVCLAVWQGNMARDLTGKFVGIFLPNSAFVSM